MSDTVRSGSGRTHWWVEDARGCGGWSGETPTLSEFYDAGCAQLQFASMQEAQKQGRRLGVVSGEDEEAASPEQRSLQRPRVFYRRETEAQPFIVAVP